MEKKQHGGKRAGAGPRLKYNEPLVAVIFWCPESKEKEFKKSGKEQIATWALPPEKRVKKPVK